MLWFVILMALAIPLAVVILDSPAVRALADRSRGGGPDGSQGSLPSAEMKQLAQKVDTMETELELVNRELSHLKETQEYLQQLLENPAPRDPKKLPKPPA